jgi:hypothetical protein
MIWGVKFLAFLAVFVGPCLAQPTNNIVIQGNCRISFTFTSAGTLALPDNTGPACTYWTINYASSGFTGLTLSVQEAPDTGNTPGTYIDWPGIVVSGSQPNTAITQASTVLSGYYRYLRISLSGLSGSGVITGTMMGRPVLP